MWVKSYIKHGSNEFIQFNLYFKNGKIYEIESENFKNILAFENNSELADNIEIHKTHKRSINNNFCKYFIKKSIDNEVHLTYLKISYIQYLKLQWQLKKFMIQSKELKLDILKYLITGILGYLIGKYIS